MNLVDLGEWAGRSWCYRLPTGEWVEVEYTKSGCSSKWLGIAPWLWYPMLTPFKPARFRSPSAAA